MGPHRPEWQTRQWTPHIEDLPVTIQDRVVEMIRLYAAAAAGKEGIQAAALLPIIVNKTKTGEGLHHSDPEFHKATGASRPTDGTLDVAVSDLNNVISRFQREFGEYLPFELTIEPFQERGRATYRAVFRSVKTTLRQRAENAELRAIDLEGQLKAASAELEAANAKARTPNRRS